MDSLRKKRHKTDDPDSVCIAVGSVFGVTAGGCSVLILVLVVNCDAAANDQSNEGLGETCLSRCQISPLASGWLMPGRQMHCFSVTRVAVSSHGIGIFSESHCSTEQLGNTSWLVHWECWLVVLNPEEHWFIVVHGPNPWIFASPYFAIHLVLANQPVQVAYCWVQLLNAGPGTERMLLVKPTTINLLSVKELTAKGINHQLC